MASLFAVLRTHGADWDESKRPEDQLEWTAHAAFMDALHAEGFAALVGPLEGTPHALLILRADSAEQIRARLDGDPWTANGLLHIALVAPWTLRLGSLDAHHGRDRPHPTVRSRP